MTRKNKSYETPESFFKLGEEFFRALRKLEGVYKKKTPDISSIKTKEDYENVKRHRGFPFLFALINVKLFLARHSLELLLKAYLLHAGVSPRDLRDKEKYHHNLERCLNGARRNGLRIFSSLQDNPKDHLAKVLIRELNKDWRTTQYKYPNELKKMFSEEYLNVIWYVLRKVKYELAKKCKK